MRGDPLFRLLFVLYCIEAGVFLVLAPWSTSWDASVALLPLASAVQGFLLHSVVRGAVSGFGLVHLVWGIHDLQLLFPFRKRI